MVNSNLILQIQNQIWTIRENPLLPLFRRFFKPYIWYFSHGFVLLIFQSLKKVISILAPLSLLSGQILDEPIYFNPFLLLCCSRGQPLLCTRWLSSRGSFGRETFRPSKKNKIGRFETIFIVKLYLDRPVINTIYLLPILEVEVN